MFKSILNFTYLFSYLVQPQAVKLESEEKSELFHFLKVVATEELDKLDAWESDDLSDEYSDIDETMIEIPSDMFTPTTLPKSSRAISKRQTSPKHSSKKTSKCKGITRR